MKIDTETAAHKAWLGLLQPVGLVVSPPALVKAQAVLDRNVVELQQELLAIVRRPPRSAAVDDPTPYLDDFPTFAERILGWSPDDLKSGDDLPPDLEVVLPDYGETLRPSYAVVDAMADGKVLLLVQEVPPGTPLDKPPKEEKTGWHASPHAKLERLLREKGVAAGLLSNGHELRIVYAPRGESSGHLTFPVKALCEVAERRVLSALHLLLSEHRVFSAPDGRRLLDLLVESRKYQNEVSNKLSEQVLRALWELLRGFQAADEVANRLLIDRAAREDPDHVYGGLLTVLLRLVFLLYAEDEGLMPNDEVYVRNYSVAGLYERLREDEGRYPDTMDQRYGAWAWLLSLFRLVFDGGGHGAFELPTRHGQLFNPDEHPFLEGRPYGVARVVGERCNVPRVSDGCVYRVLQGLLVLDGERLSYRALDVEQIGSVYEAMMGFSVERAFGRSLAVKPKHVVVDVDALLEVPPAKRAAWLKDEAECALAGNAAAALKEAKTAEDVVAALGRKVSRRTQQLQPPGALYLQPGEERRRSGSHYTPRELTEPIVRTTLRPVLEALGERPTPEQILDLKVCDPAMGSGAFLVEACRQLAEALVRAWEVHDRMPSLPPDEDSLLHARRLVAQRCLYGVDKNPFAVNLAKLSLWLVTLAKDHAFTFIDHALKHGDSLVGLTRDQIAAFHWKQQSKDWGPLFEGITESVETASAWRRKIQSFDEGDYEHKKEAWRQSEDALFEARLVGDLVIAAFFGAEKDKAREDLRVTYQKKVDDWRAGTVKVAELQGIVEGLRGGERAVPAFHWEIEFPEVFAVPCGFDAIIGNPPFLGGSRISTANGKSYYEFLKNICPAIKGKVDLVLFFLHRMSDLLERHGCIGLVATYRVGDGANALCGLRPFTLPPWKIYWAIRERTWPGNAAVRISQFTVTRNSKCHVTPILDSISVDRIGCDLRSSVDLSGAKPLEANAGRSYIGAKPDSLGFILSDEERGDLLRDYPDELSVIRRYIVGEDLTTRPTRDGSRWIIDFSGLSESDARRFPHCLGLVRERVKPSRDRLNRKTYRDRWWQFTEPQIEAHTKARTGDRVLAISRVTKYVLWEWISPFHVIADKIALVITTDPWVFAVLHSSFHEYWAFRSGGKFGVGGSFSYSPTRCFRTYPFPEPEKTVNEELRALADDLAVLRANYQLENNIGLTEYYNRFHAPDCETKEIAATRRIHEAIDKRTAEGYGWGDLDMSRSWVTLEDDDKEESRYTISHGVREKILARLLNLNQKRYQEEVLAGFHAENKNSPKQRAGRKRDASQAPVSNQKTLFDEKNQEAI